MPDTIRTDVVPLLKALMDGAVIQRRMDLEEWEDLPTGIALTALAASNIHAPWLRGVQYRVKRESVFLWVEIHKGLSGYWEGVTSPVEERCRDFAKCTPPGMVWAIELDPDTGHIIGYENKN